MKEFFLGLLRICYELYVVHDENIVVPVLVFEIVGTASLHCIDVIHREALGGYIKDLHTTTALLEMVADGLYEMCFSPTRAAINEERIINEAGPIDECTGRGVRELVEGTHYKRLEGVARVEIVSLVYIHRRKIKWRCLWGALTARR